LFRVHPESPPFERKTELSIGDFVYYTKENAALIGRYTTHLGRLPSLTMIRIWDMLIRLFIFVLFFSAIGFSAQAEPQRVGHARVELAPEMDTIAPGQRFRVGLRFILDEHWHVYWRNPGDAGLPPTIEWDLPNGFEAGVIAWPFPEKFTVPPLMSYGYHHEILLPVTITSPPDLQPGTTVELAAEAKWLVCKEECIPGEATLSVTLPVAQAPRIDTGYAELFADADDRRPLEGHGWSVAASVMDSTIELDLVPPEWFTDSPGKVDFLPYESKIINNAAPQVLARTENGYRLTVERSIYSLEKPERLAGILISESGWRGPGSERAIAFDVSTGAEPTEVVAATTDAGGVLRALLFALLGGLILNLMPCVLPVLSIKVLGFVQQANEGRRSPLGHGLVFTAGVLMSFWVLAGVLMILRAGGQQLGWGFQLQSPTFLVILSGFMFLFGLNLMGVFEVGTSLTSVGGGARRAGWSGSFLSGVTATVVATPCTAPFMGSALGFSLAQPAWVGWLIFTALGLGMAAPYVVLSASPALLKFVPKPGRWMETLKQFMGFLLMATVIWLAWVLGVQAGVTAVMVLLIALLALGLGAWVYGRWGGFAVAAAKRRAAYIVAALLVVVGIVGGVRAVDRTAEKASVTIDSDGAITWEPFSRERVRELRVAGEAVFIDFTAAWCLSCKVNERVAFSSEEVQERFDELDIVALKADWTSRSDEITQALAEYGRNSVPLYVLYGSGEKQPIILPEILTPGIVLDALNKIKN